jgi:hypothetical protein
MRAATTLTTGGIAVILALGGCGKQQEQQPDRPRDTAKVRAEARRQRAACASPVVNDRLKGLIFDQAIGERHANRTNLDELADYSFARMEDPVVTGADATLDIIRCKGRFILDIPAGAERAFAGERRLQADLDYSAQAAADGSGFVYRVNGAEPIVARLASFNLTSVAYRPPPAIDQGPAALPAPVPTAPPPAPSPPPPVIARAAPPERVPSAAPTRSPPRREPVAVEPARPRPRPPAPHREPVAVDRALPTATVAADDRGEAKVRAATDDSGEATVRAFYRALGAGDGAIAATRIVPEKRASGAFSPAAMSRYYGGLADPIRLTSIAAIAPGSYRVGYRYAAGRSRCAGAAIVSVTQRDGRDFIRSIRALHGC